MKFQVRFLERFQGELLTHLFLKEDLRMTAKEYLSQAFRIDTQINCKLEQIQSLRDLSTRTGMELTDMPGSPNRNIDRMEKTIAKIIDLKNEIDVMVDRLVDLKVQITHVVNDVDDVECRSLLELRYLCFKTWEQIACELGYTTRNIHILHGKALSMISVPQ